MKAYGNGFFLLPPKNSPSLLIVGTFAIRMISILRPAPKILTRILHVALINMRSLATPNSFKNFTT